MTEMAKYLKKRRISLRDIICKTLKSSREDFGDVLADNPVDEIALGERRNVASFRDDNKDDDGKVIGARSCGAASGTQRQLGVGDDIGVRIFSEPDRGSERGEEKCDDLSSFERDTPQVAIDSDENSNSDRSEQFRFKSDADSSDEDFLMAKYFDSLDLSREPCEKQALSALGLPSVDTRSCRSLSAIPWPGLQKGNSLSKSCYEICSNRVPGTTCGSSCSTPVTRRRQFKPPMTASCSSNACSESEFVEVASLETTRIAKTARPASGSSSSRHETLAPLSLDRKRLIEHTALHRSPRSPHHRAHLHKLAVGEDLPSSLNVSPNLSPNMSDNTTASPLPLTSQTLPPIFSPFNLDSTTHCQHRHHCPTRPKSTTALSFRSSTSNPNIHQTLSDPAQHKKYPTCKTFTLNATAPILTRSNPNLFVTPPKGGVLKSCSTPGSSDCSRHHLSSSPTTPTPPVSPRPLSRCGRSRKMRVVKSAYQDITFDAVCDERLVMT